MTTPARNELARALAGYGPLPSSSAQLPVALDELRVHVDGLGYLEFPVRAPQAKKLRAVSVPAPFGRGAQTLTDPTVRDTWQIPTDLVRVDWGAHLDEVLQAARPALGLAPGCRLTAFLHSMLIYEPGQFFTWHQDSEKADAMVASLVVMLPSAFTGGELVIHDGNSLAAYSGSRTEATAVVFYADRFHEVREVRNGRRLTLTFNLILDEVPSETDEHNVDVVGRVGRLLTEHFSTPRRPRWRGDDRPTRRLVYLLDHQYTEKGLSWSRLKGVDAERAGLLRTAAEHEGCETGLALVEIHEMWQGDGEDADFDEDDLIESEVSLTHWRQPVDHGIEPVSLGVADYEVCASTATRDMRPHETEHEGYMGNYGNTVDRWYRRAAVIVWPSELAFVNRAEARPARALDHLRARAKTGWTERLSADLTSLSSFMAAAVRAAEDPALLLGEALSLALILPRADAELLLGPFSVDALRPSHMVDLAGLADRHGHEWVGARLTVWIGRAGEGYATGRLEQWIASLPELCTALPDARVAEALLARAWESLEAQLRACFGENRPSVRADRFALLGPGLARLLEAIAVVGIPRLGDRVLEACEAEDDLIDCLLPALRIAASWPEEIRDGSGVTRLAAHAANVLVARLARTPRESGDWSLAQLTCSECDVCGRLNAFLADDSQQQLEWPLAKPGRQHVHHRIDLAELPVTHQTRRTGRPFTLVLRKTRALFDRERQARDQARGDLEWLSSQWPEPSTVATTQAREISTGPA